MNNIAIHIEDITKRFYPGTDNEIVALAGICLGVYSGEWMYVVGGNGCGKSTLLRTIIGQYKADSGKVEFPGLDDPSIFLVEAGNQNDLVPSMTAYENLLLTNPSRQSMPSLRWYRNQKRRQELADVLARFQLGLENRLDDQAVGMSSGQQQAIVAAKVLLSGATIVLLDEFTSALDKKTAPIILQIMQNYARDNNITIVAVTHDYHSIHDTADRIVVMEAGTIKEVLRKSKSFLGESPEGDRIEHAGYSEHIISELTSEIVMERLYGQK